MVYDPRIPARELCVLGSQLERWAETTPDETAFIFHGGESWTWAETLELTRRAAAGLAHLGVQKGDHVLSWQPNNREAVLTWFGLNYLGAVYVPMNIAYRGSLLEHTIDLSDATLMVCHADLAPRLADIDTGALTDVVLTGGAGAVPSLDLAELTLHTAESLLPAVGLTAMPVDIDPWDPQYIIFTSGTTGPSKAVLSSYLQGYSMGPDAHSYLGSDERHLVNLPLFHVGGTIFLVLTLATGASAVIDTHFKTDEFWDTVRKHEVTATCLLAAMIPFLLKLPPSNDERDHTLRRAICVPWNEDAMAVGRRYGIELRTTFNMTEVSSPMVSEPFPRSPVPVGRFVRASRPGWSTRTTARSPPARLGS
ncbi:MAG: AMP-binding protein [Acidimicrobiales bacterium]